jgi:hypothetical protein
MADLLKIAEIMTYLYYEPTFSLGILNYQSKYV